MTNNIPQNAVELADKYGEKINSALEQLAAKVGVGVDHFWPVLVSQQKMEGIIQISTWIVITLITSFLFLYSYKRQETLFGESNITRKDISFLFGLMLSIFLSLSFLLETRGSITKVINPEYYALQELSRLVR